VTHDKIKLCQWRVHNNGVFVVCLDGEAHGKAVDFVVCHGHGQGCTGKFGGPVRNYELDPSAVAAAY